ncbi:MAG: hypothetical protein M1837_001429 [Sclerophora amabilis]|nr:MAG: hypothetical protein M1837_001429 [Sclerophora amabilis]
MRPLHVFPKHRDDWRLDLVGLLTVIGEASTGIHAQVITVSRMCLLPRLLPAPHALLKSSRRRDLPSVPATVAGVFSGNVQHSLNYFANLIHQVDALEQRSVTVLRVGENVPTPEPTVTIAVRQLAPLQVLGIIGCLFSIFLLVEAIWLGDGVALIVVLLLSATSMFVGLGHLWTVKLAERGSQRNVPPGDVVIRGRQGAFLIVHCVEDVARALYFGKEECVYKVSENTFRVLTGVATVFLMTSIVFLTNCIWELQATFGLAYIILNGLYWVASLIPLKWHWDLTPFRVTPIQHFHEKNYTRTLWRAIQQSGSADWVRKSDAAPHHHAWDAWLEEAGDNIHNSEWDPNEALDRWLTYFDGDRKSFNQSSLQTLPVSPSPSSASASEQKPFKSTD